MLLLKLERQPCNQRDIYSEITLGHAILPTKLKDYSLHNRYTVAKLKIYRIIMGSIGLIEAQL